MQIYARSDTLGAWPAMMELSTSAYVLRSIIVSSVLSAYMPCGILENAQYTIYDGYCPHLHIWQETIRGRLIRTLF